MSDLGRALVIAGLALAALGLVLSFAGKVPFLGRLPGDIVWRRGNTTVYLPIATSLLLSLLLTLAFRLFRR